MTHLRQELILPPLGNVEDGGATRERSKQVSGREDGRRNICMNTYDMSREGKRVSPRQSTNHMKTELAGI